MVRLSRFNPKPNPNPAKSSKIQPSQAKGNPRKKLGFPCISLSETRLFKDLRRPPGAFFLLLAWSPVGRLAELDAGAKSGTTVRSSATHREVAGLALVAGVMSLTMTASFSSADRRRSGRWEVYRGFR
jgi:hypothetical protein